MSDRNRSALTEIAGAQFVVVAPDCEAYQTMFCDGADLLSTLAGMLYMTADDMPEEERIKMKAFVDDPDNWWEFEGQPTGLDWDIGSESGTVIQVWRLDTAKSDPRIELARKSVAHLLRTLCDDPRKFWLMGTGTQSYSLLTEAHAVLNCLPVDRVRESFVPDRRKYEEYVQERKELQRLQELGAEHDGGHK